LVRFPARLSRMVFAGGAAYGFNLVLLLYRDDLD
jgi:hypothetical protein